MFSRFSLGTKFTLALLLIFFIGTIVGGLVLWNVLYYRAENQITTTGLVMLDMATSVRNYTSNEIAPLLKDKQSTSNTFIPQSVPAYSARTAFEYYHKLANVVDF